MKTLNCIAGCVAIMLLSGVSASSAAEGDSARDHVRIEKTTPGGAKVTVVEGVDPETGRRFVERSETTTTTVRAEVEPEVRTEYVEVPAEAAPGVARLAVLPAVFARHFKPEFRFRETVETSGRINLRMIFTTEHEMRMEAPSFTLSLSEAFVGSRKFDVLERARLTETMKEIDFGASEYGDVARVVPMGRALNAEYVAIPEVELIHLVEELREVPYVDTVQPRLKGKMIVRLRVVDTAETKVVAASTEEVQVERRLRADNPFLETELHNLIMDLYRTASLRLLHRTLEAVYPVRLLDVADGKVVLNRGEGAVDVGDTFEVFGLGRAYTDPDTGALLGRREDKVATIRVVRVAPKFADAEIVDGAAALAGDLSGFLCRESAESIEKKTTTERRSLAW